MALQVGQHCGGQQGISLVRRSTHCLSSPGESLLAPVVFPDCGDVWSVLGELGQHDSQEGLQHTVYVARYSDLALPNVLKQLEYRLSLEGIVSRGEVIESHSRGPDVNLVTGESVPTIRHLGWLEGGGPWNNLVAVSYQCVDLYSP